MLGISGPLNPISDNSKHIYLIVQTYVGQGNLTELDLMQICVREKLQRFEKKWRLKGKNPLLLLLSHMGRVDQFREIRKS